MKKKLNERKNIIYKVTNISNGKAYIGQTVRGLRTRKLSHLYNSYDKNANDYDVAFHRAIRKYGEESFEWSTIIECSSILLNAAEVLFIIYYDTLVVNGSGYNIRQGGDSLHGEDHPQYNRVKYNFFHQSGKQEIGITQYNMYTKYNIHQSYINALVLGKRKSTNGWVLNKDNLKPTYNFEHIDGRLIQDVTTTQFRDITGESYNCTCKLINGSFIDYKGWRLKNDS